MIRPMSARDSSLRSEWHSPGFFVILNELLGKEKPVIFGNSDKLASDFSAKSGNTFKVKVLPKICEIL